MRLRKGEGGAAEWQNSRRRPMKDLRSAMSQRSSSFTVPSELIDDSPEDLSWVHFSAGGGALGIAWSFLTSSLPPILLVLRGRARLPQHGLSPNKTALITSDLWSIWRSQHGLSPNKIALITSDLWSIWRSQHGLSPNKIALITSDCVCNALPPHQNGPTHLGSVIAHAGAEGRARLPRAERDPVGQPRRAGAQLPACETAALLQPQSPWKIPTAAVGRHGCGSTAYT